VQPPSWSRDMEALLGASFCCSLRWRASYLNSCASNALIPNSDVSRDGSCAQPGQSSTAT
jgi:hypothetical protein